MLHLYPDDDAERQKDLAESIKVCTLSYEANVTEEEVQE